MKLIMKKIRKIGILNGLALLTVLVNANQACVWFYHQPEFPEKAEKFILRLLLADVAVGVAGGILLCIAHDRRRNAQGLARLNRVYIIYYLKNHCCYF